MEMEDITFPERQTLPSQANGEERDVGSEYCCVGISLVFIFLTFPFVIWYCFMIIPEYERVVLFRLGRLLPGARGPGIVFVIPCTDESKRVDLRTRSFDIPPQEILTKDSVTIAVDAVVYFRVRDATANVANVEDSDKSTMLLSQTTLRNILGTKSLGEILSDREEINNGMQSIIDEATDPWGIKVERVEIKDIRLPPRLQRTMASEAEAAREAKAKVISAEGEMNASKRLKEAADILSQSPNSIQLRYLQTLSAISAKDNNTIVFPLDMNLVKGLVEKFRKFLS